VEAGVPSYIDRALASSYKELLPVYQQLLPMFNKAATTLGASSFADLPASDQVALLVQFEGGTPPGVPASRATTAADGFQLLLAHMREGMFADPMYGGNRHLAGWTLIGYPGIQLSPSAVNQQIGTVVKPTGETATTLGGAPYNGPYADA
jgi:gluconate 2-dehydrogenase alpha chain